MKDTQPRNAAKQPSPVIQQRFATVGQGTTCRHLRPVKQQQYRYAVQQCQ